MIDLTKFKNQNHSPLSASGSERWLECPGSVALSLDQPEPPARSFALEGSLAHEYYEEWLYRFIDGLEDLKPIDVLNPYGSDGDMYKALLKAVNHLYHHTKGRKVTIFPEQKIPLTHIHESMFGTADEQIISDDVLEIWDYKHGKGKIVELIDRQGRLNTQLAYYALGAAHKYDYKFKKVVVGIKQPRASHVDGNIRSVSISMTDLKKYNDIFRRGVDRVFSKNPKLNVGPWCHWCRAEKVCP